MFAGLFLGLLLLPATVVLLLLAVLGRKMIYLKVLAGLWMGLIGLGVVLFIVGQIMRRFTEKALLTKADYYGTYIIDRTKFPGRQADWQYNHFRFTITPDDKIAFHVTEHQTVVRTYTGAASTVKP